MKSLPRSGIRLWSTAHIMALMKNWSIERLTRHSRQPGSTFPGRWRTAFSMRVREFMTCRSANGSMQRGISRCWREIRSCRIFLIKQRKNRRWQSRPPPSGNCTINIRQISSPPLPQTSHTATPAKIPTKIPHIWRAKLLSSVWCLPSGTIPLQSSILITPSSTMISTGRRWIKHIRFFLSKSRNHKISTSRRTFPISSASGAKAMYSKTKQHIRWQNLTGS